MLTKHKRITLVASVIAFAGGAMIANVSSAGEQKRESSEESHCLGLEGASWIECQKALKQKKKTSNNGAHFDYAVPARQQRLTDQGWLLLVLFALLHEDQAHMGRGED